MSDCNECVCRWVFVWDVGIFECLCVGVVVCRGGGV